MAESLLTRRENAAACLQMTLCWANRGDKLLFAATYLLELRHAFFRFFFWKPLLN
jgi:hypothetical protein